MFDPSRTASRGQRAYGKVPRNRVKNTPLIASMTLEGGMGESVTIGGTTDAEIFETYVERFLAPTLEEGQAVVLDRLGAHRTRRAKKLIEARGAQLLFLPSYSPDLNGLLPGHGSMAPLRAESTPAPVPFRLLALSYP